MIDICITTHHNPIKLEKCLTSIIDKTKGVDYRILLWCNDPNEAVKTIVDKFTTNNNFEPVFNKNNSGSFSSNNNNISKKGNAEYICFLNDDCYPQNDDWLYNMSNILKTDEKVGVVGALLLYPDNRIQHCGVFFSNRTNNLPYHMHYRKPIDNVKDFVMVSRYYQAVTGACILLRREDFKEIGGFCEEFYYMYEDIALCLDIKNKCHKSCVYCPSAVLTHDEGISKDGRQNLRFKENIAIFKEKYFGKTYNDLEFYLENSKHLIYKFKG